MNYTKIAIGIVLKNNRVYITKAKKFKYNKNLWEFPGGKIKRNENIISGLKRELFEEIGIKILNFQFFQYKRNFFKKNELYFFLINKFKGKAYSKEGYQYSWIYLNRLKFWKFPISNYIVIKKLKNIS